MNNPPPLTKNDADRILKRAAEIEGSEDSRPITVDELRSIAGEAGFGTRAIERAIAEAQQAAVTVRRAPLQKSGLVIRRILSVRTIPIEISSEELMRAVRLLQPYREGPAQVKLEEHQITWRDRKGIWFTVTSSGGTTELKVMVSRPMLRRPRWAIWVQAAADRLETLVLMVAAQSPKEAPALEPPSA
jgi:hypothetical protein